MSITESPGARVYLTGRHHFSINFMVFNVLFILSFVQRINKNQEKNVKNIYILLGCIYRMRKLCFLVVMERYAYRCLLKKKGVGYTGKVYVGFLQRKGSRKKGKPAFLFLFCTEYKSLLGFWYLGGFNSYFFTGFSDIYIFFYYKHIHNSHILS
jgi:hypothetical protein